MIISPSSIHDNLYDTLILTSIKPCSLNIILHIVHHVKLLFGLVVDKEIFGPSLGPYKYHKFKI